MKLIRNFYVYIHQNFTLEILGMLKNFFSALKIFDFVDSKTMFL